MAAAGKVLFARRRLAAAAADGAVRSASAIHNDAIGIRSEAAV